MKSEMFFLDLFSALSATLFSGKLDISIQQNCVAAYFDCLIYYIIAKKGNDLSSFKEIVSKGLEVILHIHFSG